jgi:hypothetical protein
MSISSCAFFDQAEGRLAYRTGFTDEGDDRSVRGLARIHIQHAHAVTDAAAATMASIFDRSRPSLMLGRTRIRGHGQC